VIFVPGNGYPQMAAHAAELWKEGFAPYVLPSGRYSTVLGHFAGVQDLAEQYGGNYETEWEFLRTVLQKNGVPEKAILREDQATYTYENALRSREVTDAAGIEVKKAILCCRNLHARRCILYYQLVYPETEFFVCPSDIEFTRENWHTKGEWIDQVLGEMERCGGQFHKILRELPADSEF
jgi:uncharacterized SAM-binding protein YcdF (DUF218 family)